MVTACRRVGLRSIHCSSQCRRFTLRMQARSCISVVWTTNQGGLPRMKNKEFTRRTMKTVLETRGIPFSNIVVTKIFENDLRRKTYRVEFSELTVLRTGIFLSDDMDQAETWGATIFRLTSQFKPLHDHLPIREQSVEVSKRFLVRTWKASIIRSRVWKPGGGIW